MARTNEELEISLTDVLRSVWDVKWIVIVLTLLGGLVGTVIPAARGPSYETSASMLVTAARADGTYRSGGTVPQAEDIYLSQNLAKTVQLLATSSRVLKQVLSLEEFSGMLPEELTGLIRVEGVDGTAFLRLTLSWQNGEQAVGLLNRLMEILPEIMLEVMDIGGVSVIDTAQQPVMVRGPAPKAGAAGALLGFAAGAGAGILYYLFAPKVRGADSLAQLNLDILGTIPQLPKGVSACLDEGAPPVKYQEAYGRLAAVFRYLTEKENRRLIAFTSSAPGEGKSTAIYNLSLRLTEAGQKVLLLDFDFKQGALYRLSKTRKPSDGNVRSEHRTGENLQKCVEKMYNGIYIIQGFSEKDIFRVDNSVYPAIKDMKSQFDYILIDTPPVGTLSDVQQMGGLLEGILIIARQNTAFLNAVSDSVSSLEQTGIPVIGCVLNGKRY